MKKFMIAVAAASLLLGGVSIVQSEEQDVAKIKCSDFLQDKENMGLILMWLDGYMSQQSDNTVLSDEWIEKLSMHMATYCSKNPNTSILEAAVAME